MPSMVVLLLSAALAHAPTPEKIVLYNDPAAVSFEQTLVRHMLMQNLAADASTPVWTDVRPSLRERRAMRLRRRAQQHVIRARQHLESLAVEEGMVEAAKARQQLTRVAILTGDPLLLCDSLALLSASLLLSGATQAGQKVLEELLVLEPTFVPPSSLFNPAMQQRVARTRLRLDKAPRVALTVTSPTPGTALFVDGVFVGFEQQSVSVVPFVPHLVWAIGTDGQHKAMRLSAKEPTAQRAPQAVTLVLDAPQPLADVTHERMATALEASRSPHLSIRLDAPALRAMRVGRVLVLAYGEGELTLTHLQLAPNERRRVKAPAIVTDVRDADRIARALLAAPPELVPLPTPPRSLSPHASNARL